MNAIEGEVRQKPDINWAKIARDPKTGDFYGEGLGITAIGVDSSLTEAKLEGQSVMLRNRQTPGVEESETRLYIGKIDWSRKMIKVDFGKDFPISFEDSGRINRSASLAIQLMETEKAWRTSLEVREISREFERLMTGLLPQSDVDTFNSIAVAMDRLKLYVNRDYPEEFLRIAEVMDDLGITMIGPEIFGEAMDFWTVDHLRGAFGEKGKTAA